MKIRKAWYHRQLETQIIVELPDGFIGMTSITPARVVEREELRPYVGYAPAQCCDPIPESSWRMLYGFTKK